MRAVIVILLVCLFLPAYAQWEELGLPVDSLKPKRPIKERSSKSKSYRKNGQKQYAIRLVSLFDKEGRMIQRKTIRKFYPHSKESWPSSTITIINEKFYYTNNYLTKKTTQEIPASGLGIFITELYKYEDGKLLNISSYTSADTSVIGKERSVIRFEYNENGKRKSRWYIDSLSSEVTRYSYDSLLRLLSTDAVYMKQDTLRHLQKTQYSYKGNRVITKTLFENPGKSSSTVIQSCLHKNGKVMRCKKHSLANNETTITRNKYTSWGALKKSVKRERGMVRYKYKVDFTYY